LENRNLWDRLNENRAMPPEESKATELRVLRGILANFHPRQTVAIAGGLQPASVLDRSRTWLAHIEMIELLLGEPVKVIVPVRDVRDILASLEMLWRKQKALSQFPAEAFAGATFESVWGRCKFWMDEKDGWLGLAYTRLRDARDRGFGDRLHLVQYEALTAWPEDVLKDFYDFLDEEPFDHNLAQVETVIRENDQAYGIPGLHAVRPIIEPRDHIWPEILGAVAEPYAVLNEALGYPPAE
jgi:sulfotransferase